MSCRICGDDVDTPARCYWSPDDGWFFANLCDACIEDHGNRQPHPDDYAWDWRGTLDDDCIQTDEDISSIL